MFTAWASGLSSCKQVKSMCPSRWEVLWLKSTLFQNPLVSYPTNLVCSFWITLSTCRNFCNWGWGGLEAHVIVFIFSEHIKIQCQVLQHTAQFCVAYPGKGRGWGDYLLVLTFVSLLHFRFCLLSPLCLCPLSMNVISSVSLYFHSMDYLLALLVPTHESISLLVILTQSNVIRMSWLDTSRIFT